MKNLIGLLILLVLLVPSLSAEDFKPLRINEDGEVQEAILQLGQQMPITIFRDGQVAIRELQIADSFEYEINDFDFNILETGSASQSNSLSQMNMTVSTGAEVASVTVTSRNRLHYDSSREVFAYFTSRYEDGGSGIEQWVGLFDEDNGYAIGKKDGVFGILHRLNGSDTFIPQSSFNVDKLDSTGSSSMDIQEENVNLYIIRYGYLGTGDPQFYTFDTTLGQWILFHRLKWSGLYKKGHVGSTNLPMRATINKTSGSLSAKLGVICWSSGLVGAGQERPNHRTFDKIREDNFNANADRTILILRNKTTFQGKANKITAFIRQAFAGCESQRLAFVRVWLNPTFQSGSPSYTDQDTDRSIMEYSGDDLVVTGGTLIGSDIIGVNGGTGKVILGKDSEQGEAILPGDVVAVTIEITSGNNNVVGGGAKWEEAF